MEVAGSARERAERFVKIGLLGLEFLHTQHIGRMRLQPGLEAFFMRRPDAIEVEGDNSQHLV